MTLTNLSDAFTLRFTGSGDGIVLDNVVLRAGPAQAPEPTEPAPTTVALSSLIPSTTAPLSASQIALTTTVSNTGAVAIAPATIRFYRHTSTTDTPTTGTRIVQTASTGTLDPNASVTQSITTTVPTVSTATTYYYYACIDATCSQPAIVQVRPASAILIEEVSVNPTNPQSGTPITLQFTARNTGSTALNAQTVRFYRHTTPTDTPTTGTRIVQTASTGTLDPNASATQSITTTVPTVTQTTTYYYYACIDTICSDAATVRVTAAGVMGGDRMISKLKYGSYGGTLTLGGLETTDGTKGFVASGHVVEEVLAPLRLPENGYVLDDDGDYTVLDDNTLLGKIFRMPRIYTEGTKKIASVDAGFIMYPRASTLGCSVIYQHDGKTFCFDAGQGTYTETVQPLVVRGRNDTVHRVIGSKQPTEGLAVRISGSRSGVIDDLRVGRTMILSQDIDTIGTDRPLYLFYNYTLKPGQYAGVGASMAGDSGSPVYTVPDENGDVRMVGIHVGSFTFITDYIADYGTIFSSWDDVTDALDLKPITP